MLRLLKSSVAIVALTAPTLAPNIAGAEIGVLAAVNRDMTGARPAEQSRPIFINEQLVTDETIETSANGGGQVLFLDQTSLTIAPDSKIVLDQYVYDPNAQSGQIGLTVARGAMRLIGGRITKENAATIKTPSATIGIRGGMGNVSVSGEDTVYMHVAGISSTIDSGSDSLTITRQGGLARVGSDGMVEFLGIATSDLVEQIFGAAATGNGDGGAAAASVGGAGDAVSGQISEADGLIDAAPISTSGERQTLGFDDPAVSLEVAPLDEFAEAEIMQNVMDEFDDDIPLAADALAFTGDIDLNLTFDDAGSILTDVEVGSLFMALSLNNGNGFIDVVTPFDTGVANPETGEVEGIADVFLLAGQNGEFTANSDSALGGSTSATVILNGQEATGGFNVDYGDLPVLLQDINGRILLNVSGTVDRTADTSAPSAEVQQFIDEITNILVAQ